MEKIERVRKLAQMVFAQYSLKVPVDLEPIIHDVCTVEMREDAPVDGYTDLECDPPKMILQPGGFRKRVRFTKAHELGHILIPWHNGKTTYADRRNAERLMDRNEEEADAFAAELLLPQSWVEGYLRDAKHKPVSQQIKEIVEIGDVSVLACLRTFQKYWSPGQMLFYTLPDWDHYDVCIPDLFHFAPYHSLRPRTISFYEQCAVTSESFQNGSYQMYYFKFIDLAEDMELLAGYEAAGNDVAQWLERLSGGVPVHAVPYFDQLFSILPDRVAAYVFLEGHAPAVFCSKRSNIPYFPTRADFESEKRNLLQEYPDHLFYELSLGSLGSMMILKSPYNPVPSESSRDPNRLLAQLLEEVYPKEELRIRAGRKVNGYLGGNNNRKNKGSEQDFYDEVFDRMKTDSLLRPLLHHPGFPKFLLGKIRKMLN